MPQPESLSNDTSIPTNKIDVIAERVSNIQLTFRDLQDTLKSSVDSFNDRFDKWEERNSAIEQFQNRVLGGIQTTAFTVRVLGWALGIIQAIALVWVGAVNLALHTTETDVTTLKVQYEVEAKNITERNTSNDSRFDAFSRHLSEHDAEIQKLEIDDASGKPKAR